MFNFILRKYFLFLLVIFLLLPFNTIFSEENSSLELEQAEPSINVIVEFSSFFADEIFLDNFDYKSGEIVRGYIVVENEGDKPMFDYKYTMALGRNFNENISPELIYGQTDYYKFSLSPREKKKINFEYKIPAGVEGNDVAIYFQFFDLSNHKITFNKSPSFNISGGLSEVTLSKVGLLLEEEPDLLNAVHPLSGPIIKKDSFPREVYFMAELKNEIGQDLKLIPKIEIFDFLNGNELIYSEILPEFIISDNETVVKKYIAPLFEYKSGVYDVKINYLDELGNVRVPDTLYKYIINSNLLSIRDISLETIPVIKNQKVNFSINYFAGVFDFLNPTLLDGFDVVMVAEFFDEDDTLVGTTKNDFFATSQGVMESDFTPLKNAKTLKVKLKFFNEDSELITSREFVIYSDLEIPKAPNNYFFVYVGLIFLVLILLSSFLIAKRKKGIILSLIILVLFSNINSVFVFSQSISGSATGRGGYGTIVVTLSNVHSVYKDLEIINAKVTYSATICNNNTSGTFNGNVTNIKNNSVVETGCSYLKTLSKTAGFYDDSNRTCVFNSSAGLYQYTDGIIKAILNASVTPSGQMSNSFTAQAQKSYNVVKCRLYDDTWNPIYTKPSNGCLFGTQQNLADTNTQFLWNCSSGEKSVFCSAPRSQMGVCKTYTQYYNTQPATNNSTGCVTGTYSDRTNDSKTFNWSCLGVGKGGSDYWCSAKKRATCTTYSSTYNTQPATNSSTGCVAGDYQDDLNDTDTQFKWKCVGHNWFENTANCSANRVQLPVCKTYSGVYSTQPATNNNTGCSFGDYTDLVNTSIQFKWQCKSGANTVSCSATRQAESNIFPGNFDNQPANNSNGCVAGDYTDLSDTDSLFRWQCGSGTNIAIGRANRVPQCKTYSSTSYSIQPATDNSTGCVRGAYEDIVDTSTQFKWKCVITTSEDVCSASINGNQITNLSVKAKITPPIVNRGEYCNIIDTGYETNLGINNPLGLSCNIYRNNFIYADKDLTKQGYQVEPGFDYIFKCIDVATDLQAQTKPMTCVLNPVIKEI